MAIAFRAAGANKTYTAVTTVTVNAPAGVAATDVVLAIFGSTGIGRSSQPSITAPAGWTLVKAQQDTVNFGDLTVFWALGTVNFANSFTIGNGGNVSGSCFSLAYTGVSNTTPMDATAVGQNNATSTTETAPSITTVTTNTWLVGVYLWFASAGALPTYSLEFGTHRLNGGLSAGRGGSTSVDTCDLLKAATGASGTKTVTVSATAVSSGILIALKASTATTFNDSITEAGTAASSLANAAMFENALAETGASASTLATTATFPNTITESGTALDALSTTVVFRSALSESGSATDSLSSTVIPGGGGGTTFNDTITETGTAAIALSSAQTFASSLTEALAAADSLVNHAFFASSVSFAGSATDSLVNHATFVSTISAPSVAADSFVQHMVMPNTLTESRTATATASAPSGSTTYNDTITESLAGVKKTFIFIFDD